MDSKQQAVRHVLDRFPLVKVQEGTAIVGWVTANSTEIYIMSFVCETHGEPHLGNLRVERPI